jgi:hypothetical protein
MRIVRVLCPAIVTAIKATACDGDDDGDDACGGYGSVSAAGGFHSPPANPAPEQLQLELPFVHTPFPPTYPSAHASSSSPMPSLPVGDRIVPASSLEVEVCDAADAVRSDVQSSVTVQESCWGPAVSTALDTSVVGCHDYSLDNMDPRGSCDGSPGYGCSVLNEMTFLQINTRLDETGVVRPGSGVSMAGDLCRKVSRASSILGPDESVFSATARGVLWSKSFFALRGHMLTRFDPALRKVVASDVRGVWRGLQTLPGRCAGASRGGPGLWWWLGRGSVCTLWRAASETERCGCRRSMSTATRRKGFSGAMMAE